MSKTFAEIAIPIPIDCTFTYAVSPELRLQLEIGKRVVVPFRKFEKTGYCVGFSDSSTLGNIKEIIKVIDEQPVVNAVMLNLSKWISEHYLCSWGEALECAVPPSVRRSRAQLTQLHIKLRVPPQEALLKADELRKKYPSRARILELLSETSGVVPFHQITQRIATSFSPLKGLRKDGLIEIFKQAIERDPFYEIKVTKSPPPAPDS